MMSTGTTGRRCRGSLTWDFVGDSQRTSGETRNMWCPAIYYRTGPPIPTQASWTGGPQKKKRGFTHTLHNIHNVYSVHAMPCHGFNYVYIRHPCTRPLGSTLRSTQYAVGVVRSTVYQIQSSGVACRYRGGRAR